MDKKAAPNEQIAEDFVSDEEEALAKELRRWCTRFGEEQDEFLSESGTALLNLGKLYLRKAQSNTGMLQKLSFIKACALINGARVRFELIGDKNLALKAVESLEVFSKAMYEICHIKNSKSIVEISRYFLRKLNKMRTDARSMLSKIARVDDDLEDDELLAKELTKISDVKKLTEQMTEDYKAFLCEISQKCIELLGAPPCRFAQVGLGSLARKEITFYSDFEHVLVLEDEAKLRDDYAQILEYFRWFAVLFQCILIGFGETVIRSVGVKSMNDLYSTDKTKNWFYDVITPSGVAFDGMVPHSCMNPLGRQDPTKTRRHVVEFIQPASEMAKFLTVDEHIKNGYYIKDILARTCFVYGDENVFEKFFSESKVILNSEKMADVARQEVEKIDSNAVVHLKALIDLKEMDGIDAKVTFYRPVTALLAYFARSRGIKTPSTFDIITELRQREVITKTTEHKVKFGWAVGCEIRLKAYFAAGQQRHRVTLDEIEKMVSPSSVYKCRETITFLSAHVKGIAILVPDVTDNSRQQRPEDVFIENPSKKAFSKANWLVDQEKYNEAIVLCVVALHVTKSPADSYRLRRLLAESYFALGLKQQDKRSDLWEQAREEYHTLLAMGSEPILRAACYRRLASIYEHQGVNETAIKMCAEWYKLYRTDKNMAYMYHHGLIVVIPMDIRIRRRTVPARELLEYLKELGAQEKHIDGRFLIEIEIAKTKIVLGLCDEAKSHLNDLVQNICAHSRPLRDPKVLLQDIIQIQVNNKWYAAGNHALDSLLGLPRRFGTSFDAGVYKQDVIDALKLICLSSLDRNQDGMDYFEKMSEKSQRSYADFWSGFVLNHACTVMPVGEDKLSFWETTQRGVNLCKKYPKEAKFLNLYTAILSQVGGGYGPFFVNEVADIFCPAPSHVRNDERVVGAVGQELRAKFLVAYLTSERGMTLEKASEHVKVALANYSRELEKLDHPSVYYTIAKVISAPDRFVTGLLVRNLDLISRLFGLAALSEEEYASILWRIVNMADKSKRDPALQLLLEMLATSCGQNYGCELLKFQNGMKTLATELGLRKEIAEIQLANGEKEKARSNLSKLVKIIRYCGKWNDELKLLLKIVMFLQRQQGWTDDALVTVDLVLSLMRLHGDPYDAVCDQCKLDLLLHAGVYDIGIKHIEQMCRESIRENSLIITVVYSMAAMKSENIEKGFPLINQGLGVAKEFSGEAEYETMYVRSLIFFLRNARAENLQNIADLFNSAPHAVQRHSDVEPLVNQFLRRILSDATTHRTEDVKAQLNALVGTPLLAAAHSDILYTIAAQHEKMQTPSQS